MAKLVFVVALYMFFVCKVNGHGGMIYPPTWVDAKGIGLDMKQFSHNGCFEKGPVTNVYDGPYKVPYPNCNWLWFNNAVRWTSTLSKAKGSMQKLKERIDSNVPPRMPRKMFIYKINDTIAKYNSSGKRADLCSTLDLNTSNGFRQYTMACTNPWFQPGLAELGSPCGVGGGNQVGHPGGVCGHSRMLKKDGTCVAGYAKGQRAETYSYPNAKTTSWRRGNAEIVGFNIQANHGGGYAYRLCKTPTAGIKGVTEDCFRNGHLNFVGPQYVRDQGTFKWIKETPVQTTVGTWPKASMWRKNYYFSMGTTVRGKYSGQILDAVRVPQNLTPGDYVLSWRWDCEVSGQTWSTCSNIKVV